FTLARYRSSERPLTLTLCPTGERDKGPSSVICSTIFSLRNFKFSRTILGPHRNNETPHLVSYNFRARSAIFRVGTNGILKYVKFRSSRAEQASESGNCAALRCRTPKWGHWSRSRPSTTHSNERLDAFVSFIKMVSPDPV